MVLVLADFGITNVVAAAALVLVQHSTPELTDKGCSKSLSSAHVEKRQIRRFRHR